MKKRKWTYPIFRIIKWFVWLVYPKMKVEGFEYLPKDEPVIYVGNHTQMNGPIASELYLPDRYTWCSGEMMKMREVPAYAFRDFWSEKPRLTRPFYKLLSYLIAPLSVIVFTNADTIPVYHDSRLLTTFRETIKRLSEGKSIVIFPEHDVPYNHIVYEFQDKYIDIANLYFKKYNKELCFVPLYIAPNLKKMYIGKPLRYSHESDIALEREKITKYLMSEITDIATSLPCHKVVPYKNLPRKLYPLNKE